SESHRCSLFDLIGVCQEGRIGSVGANRCGCDGGNFQQLLIGTRRGSIRTGWTFRLSESDLRPPAAGSSLYWIRFEFVLDLRCLLVNNHAGRVIGEGPVSRGPRRGCAAPLFELAILELRNSRVCLSAKQEDCVGKLVGSNSTLLARSFRSFAVLLAEIKAVPCLFGQHGGRDVGEEF
ncbi:hypothetical protein BIW11_06739, partial [Tropilaelaps mercedesae]